MKKQIKNIQIGNKIVVNWRYDWRQHLKLPTIKSILQVERIERDDTDNSIIFIGLDGNTFSMKNYSLNSLIQVIK